MFIKILALSLLITFNVKAGEFTVGVEDMDYLPYYKTEKGQYSGYAKDLLDLFGQKYNHKFKYSPFPIARLYADFISGTIDFKYPDNPYWQKDKKEGKTITYSDSTTVANEGLIVLPSNASIQMKDIKEVSTIRGFTPFPFMDDIKSGKLKLNEVNDSQTALKMVEAKRIIGVYMCEAVAKKLAESILGSADKITLATQLPNSKSDFHLATLKHANIMKEFNEFMSKHKSEVQALKTKWGVP